MNKAGLRGGLKLMVLAAVLLLSLSLGSAATYLPSTRYINIQTEFTELSLTLEKFSKVDFIAHCPDFSAEGCPAWNLYDTAIAQNASHVSFTIYDRGAYIGVRAKGVDWGDLEAIKALMESKSNIQIVSLNLTEGGLRVEFRLPLTGAALRQVKDALVIINGLSNETGLGLAQRIQAESISYNSEQLQLRTDIVAIDAKEFSTALVRLPKSGKVNAIMRCADWSFETASCADWKKADILFTQDADYVYFNVTSFSAYGGVELKVLNVQSYPQVGDYWTVKLLTEGTANLTIEGVEGTVYGVDIEFESLKCGAEEVEVQKLSNGIFVEDYSCSGTTYHKVKVLTSGKHKQMITFGDIVRYAQNLANQMPNTLTVEGKLTNSSNDNQDGEFDIVFRIYNVATGGQPLWSESKQDVVIDDGIFSVVLGTTSALDLDWNVPYYLEIQIDGDDNMTPRINLSSTPYSQSAQRAFNLSCTDCITTTHINTSGDFRMDGNLTMLVGHINMSGSKIINLGTPTADTDAATKAYVDSQIGSGGGNTSGWIDTGALIRLITKTDSVNATSLYINNAAGKVGIGTYSPTDALTVVGNINVTGNITSTLYALQGLSSGAVFSSNQTHRLILTTNRGKW
jgi:hypothetical protein